MGMMWLLGSMVNEISELGKEDTRSVLRTWWACLVDSNLLLYKKEQDSLPYRTIPILKTQW
jgi:hypothetical protein